MFATMFMPPLFNYQVATPIYGVQGWLESQEKTSITYFFGMMYLHLFADSAGYANIMHVRHLDRIVSPGPAQGSQYLSTSTAFRPDLISRIPGGSFQILEGKARSEPLNLAPAINLLSQSMDQCNTYDHFIVPAAGVPGVIVPPGLPVPVVPDSRVASVCSLDAANGRGGQHSLHAWVTDPEQEGSSNDAFSDGYLRLYYRDFMTLLDSSQFIKEKVEHGGNNYLVVNMVEAGVMLGLDVDIIQMMKKYGEDLSEGSVGELSGRIDSILLSKEGYDSGKKEVEGSAFVNRSGVFCRVADGVGQFSSGLGSLPMKKRRLE